MSPATFIIIVVVLFLFFGGGVAAVTIGVDYGRHEGGKLIMKKIMGFLAVLYCQILS